MRLVNIKAKIAYETIMLSLPDFYDCDFPLWGSGSLFKCSLPMGVCSLAVETR